MRKLIQTRFIFFTFTGERVTSTASFFIENGSPSRGISGFVKEFEKVEVSGDFGEFLSGQIGFDHLSPLHPHIHGRNMAQELGRQIHVFLSGVSLSDVVEKRVLGRAQPCAAPSESHNEQDAVVEAA